MQYIFVQNGDVFTFATKVGQINNALYYNSKVNKTI